MEQHRCAKEADISILKEHVATLYKKLDTQNHRMDKVETKTDAQYEMAKAIAVMAEQMTAIRSDVSTVKTAVEKVKLDVDRINNQDGETWRRMKWLVLAAVVTFALGYFFNSIGG